MNVLITGASSGLGQALALYYANQDANVFICARNSKALSDFTTKNSKLKANKANIFAKTLDVTDKDAMKSWIDEIEEKYPLDLVIANAGISAGTSGGIEGDEQISKIFDINLNGVLNTINPAIKKMKERKSGQIAIISSLAGFRGLPSSPAYSASKAAVRVYAEGLRGNLAEFGIKVNAVCPGYIKTPLTDVNDFYMPFLMSPEKAVKKIVRGLKRNQSRIAFPLPFYFIVWFLTVLSPSLTDWFFSKLPKKSSL